MLQNEISDEEIQNDLAAVTVICCAHIQAYCLFSVLDGIINQKTSFGFKVIVGIDKSDEISLQLARNYAAVNHSVEIFEAEHGESDSRIFIKCAEKAGTPFIAYCSGNACWTDEYKLQNQYDFLENNPDYSFCFAGSEVTFKKGVSAAPKNFVPDINKKFIIPFCDKNFMLNQPVNAVALIRYHKFDPSTVMFRWNYDSIIPDWYYDCEPCDIALQLIQLGGGQAGFIRDNVCRTIENTDKIGKNTDPEREFLLDRMNNIRWLAGMMDYYPLTDFEDYPQGLLLSKLKTECYYYLNEALNKCNDVQSALDLFRNVPIAGKEILKYYISADADRRGLERSWGWNGYTAVIRREKPLKILKRFAQVFDRLLRIKRSKPATWVKTKCKHFVEFLCYWRYSLTPKRKNLWVVSGFPRRKYMDNTKYFFEYVSDHYPDIEIWWLTRSSEVYQEIKEAGRNVCMFGTKECRKILSHARVGVVDHYACADFERISGFNNGIGIVNLWHGVGFKAAGDENGPKWTNQPGLVRSTDILPQENDSIFRKIIKKFKYFRHAYMRELFEKYLMFVCPGQERVEMVGKIWGIPESCYFMAGHPRNEPVYNTERDAEHPLVMYAPTYRESPKNELQMVENCLLAVPKIQKLMEKVDGTFAIRLHPHTWRNYKGRILDAIRGNDRVIMDTEKDVYPYLGKYSVMISDYSSIALDFAMLDRPTIFLCPDVDDTERGFNLDFRNSVPGPIVMNWDEAIEKIENYINYPDTDSELRKEKCSYFFTPEVNGVDNSARIVEEIKKRIGM